MQKKLTVLVRLHETMQKKKKEKKKNAKKMQKKNENRIIFRTDPNSYLGT